MVKKLTWIEKVEKVAQLHKENLLAHPDWIIDDTAKLTGYSHGRICEYLMIASWIKSHPKIADFKTAHAALQYIKGRRYVQRTS